MLIYTYFLLAIVSQLPVNSLNGIWDKLAVCDCILHIILIPEQVIIHGGEQGSQHLEDTGESPSDQKYLPHIFHKLEIH